MLPGIKVFDDFGQRTFEPAILKIANLQWPLLGSNPPMGQVCNHAKTHPLCPLHSLRRCPISRYPDIQSLTLAIAYLNNEYHATGIFIYYSLLGCLLFGLSWIVFHYRYSNSKELKDSKDSEGSKGGTSTGSSQPGCGHYFLQLLKEYCKHKLLTIVALCFIISLTLIFFVILTCFFVMIPINKSISEFPNRIVGIYMSGGFVISTLYLCRKSRKHQSSNKPEEKSDSLTVVRENIKKLQKLWRDRTESERKCEDFIALKRIEEKIQKLVTSIQSTGAQDKSTTKSDET